MRATATRPLPGSWIAILVLPTMLLVILRLFPSLDEAWMWFDLHFWTTGVTALLAAIACGVLVVAAREIRGTRLLFLALAFLAIGGIFSVHGLMTPGVIKHEFHAPVAVSAWISIIVGAFFIALSAVDLPDAFDRLASRFGVVIFAWTGIVVGAFILMSWYVEDWLDNVPTDQDNVQYALALASMLLLGLAAYRYAQSYFFARLPSQAVMTVALILLLQVPPILVWGEPWHISWWLYHALYGLAFGLLFAGWGIEWVRARSLQSIAASLSMRDAIAQLNRGRDHQVVHLVDEIEAKDYYTLGHVHRVGSMAYAIGKELGLSPAQLHDVVIAAQMHDVGKIGTPDAVLLKAGPLTTDEAATMRQHTILGGEIAARVEALQPVAAAIRAHHERFDGAGYPDGLAATNIPLAARIVSVADTYDAMTSTRPYREAMSRETALAEIARVRGTQLDPSCVDAFLAIARREGPLAA